MRWLASYRLHPVRIFLSLLPFESGLIGNALLLVGLMAMYVVAVGGFLIVLMDIVGAVLLPAYVRAAAQESTTEPTPEAKAQAQAQKEADLRRAYMFQRADFADEVTDKTKKMAATEAGAAGKGGARGTSAEKGTRKSGAGKIPCKKRMVLSAAGAEKDA